MLGEIARVPALARAARPARPATRAPRSVFAPESENSGSGAIVVVQHAAQVLAALDLACVSKDARFWTDELVGQTLMIALAVMWAVNF